jgi:aminoglycoside 6'-N-acetyltransferase
VLAKVGFAEGTWFDEPQPDGGVSTLIGCNLDVAQVVG